MCWNKRKVCFKSVFYILIMILLCSCGESQKDHIEQLVKAWDGRIIYYPADLKFCSFKKDSMYNLQMPVREYTIVSYVDSIGCMSCKLQLQDWKLLISHLDDSFKEKVSCLLIFHPKNKEMLLDLLYRKRFTYPVCIDETDSFNKLNHLSTDMTFQTFLLDKNAKVIAIGNPIHSPLVKELYLNIISGKETFSQSRSQSLTFAFLSKDNINMGDFPWKQKQEAEVTLSNTGEKPLVINDVITSCGCMTAEFDKKPINQYKSANIRITYEAEYPEHFDKTITIYCNAKDSPFQLKVTGNAK